jgi:hypothetical protein
VAFVEAGYINFVELAEKLNTEQQVSFRMVLQNKEGQWLLHTLLVDIIPEELKENHPTYFYDYGLVVFIADQLPGTDIASWLMTKKGKVGKYDFLYDIQMDINQLNISWRQHPSNSNIIYAGPKFAYPFTLYNLPQPSISWGLQSGILVSDHCPFFPDVQHAISQLMYEVTDPNQLGASNQGYFVRFIHDEARIKHIEISPLLLSIEVDGTQLADTILHINGSPELEYATQVSQPQRFDYPLPQGMPPDVWIALSRGTEWLDYSYISQRWSPFRGQQKNVTYSPPDIRTQIQELIAQGEGLTTEFKQEIPSNHDKMLKTLAAFANGLGGVILLGVNNDGDVVGICPMENINKEKDRITNMIRNTVSPDPQIRIEYWDIDGRKERYVIAIFVDKGSSPLYGLHYEKFEIYIRRQATTFRARPEEIVALTLLKQPGMGYP